MNKTSSDRGLRWQEIIPHTISVFPNSVRRHMAIWVSFKYPVWFPMARSRDVSKPQDLCLELSDRSEIWQAHRQQCYRGASRISKRWYKLPISRLRELTISYNKMSYRILKWGPGIESDGVRYQGDYRGQLYYGNTNKAYIIHWKWQYRRNTAEHGSWHCTCTCGRVIQ